MATITELVIGASVEPQGVKRGLDQALNYSKAFAREVEVVVGQTFKMGKGVGFEERGAQMVEGLLGGLTSELDRQKLQLREKLARGIISREEFTKEGQKAAQGFNQALLAGISHLEGRKLLTPGMREQMVQALREDGIRAGEAFAQGIQTGTQRQAVRVGGGARPGGPGLQVGGRNAAPAVVATAFAFESLARSEAAAESGARAAARAVGTFAAGFGVGGAVVSALIAGGTAMTEWWTAREKEIEDARKKFKTELDGMVDDINASGIIQRIAQIERGQRSSGASQVAPGSFVGGLNDLTAQNVRDRAAITEALRAGNLAEVNKLVDIVRERQKSIDLLTEQREQLRSAVLNPLPQQRQAGGMMAPMQINAPAVKTEMEQMTDQVAKLSQAWQQFQALGLEPAAGFFGALARQEHAITDALKRETDQMSDRAVKLRALLVTLKSAQADGAGLENTPLPDLNTMSMNRERMMAVGIGAKPRTSMDDLRAMAERVNLLEREAAIMRAIGASGADQFEERANEARKQAIANIKGLIEATEGLSGEEADRIRSGLLEALGSMNVVAKDTRNTFNEVADAIRGVLDAADGFGVISDDLRQMVNGALGLVDAFQKASKARAAAKAGGESLSMLGALGGIGGAIGVVGAAIQVGSSIMSLFKRKNEEVVAALDRNSKRLSDVHASLMGGTDGLGAQAKGLSALNEVDRRIKETMRTNGFAGFSPKVQTALLEQTLKDMGLTMDQFKKIIADTGIELFDKNGRVIYSAIAQAQEYLDAVRKAASRLSDSLEDQSLLKELHDRVFGKTSDADAIARQLALIKQFAPNLAKQFEGLDATTKEGREAIQRALQALVTSIEQGMITPDMLGNFENIKDLINIILGVQTSLDGMKDAVDTVTASLLNVPSGYKVALARFNATDYRPPWDDGRTPGGERRRRFPGLDAAVPDFPASANMMGTFASGGGYASGGGISLYGDIYIDAQQKTAEQTFAEMLRVAKRKAAVKFGDSTRWSEVQA